MTHSLKTDICVIGAGAGGLSVAAGAAQLGLKVALIEKGEMGGDCLHTGCVPSKSLIAAAARAHAFKNSRAFGITPHTPEIDFAAVNDHIHDVIARIEPHDSQERFEGLGVTVFREAARFLSPRKVRAGKTEIHARYFVIATGSRPFVPDLPGLDPNKVFTNETIFTLREAPPRLVIIGGGPIGMEMAQAHARLGSQVTVIEAGGILSKDDPELVGILRQRLRGEGVEIFENTNIQTVRHGPDMAADITIEQDGDTKVVNGTHLLVATGRRPVLEGLDLDTAGVAATEHGITVDSRLRTSQKHILAVGDVTGGPQFTHMAGYHAGIVIRNVIFKQFARLDNTAVPWVTYSDPELANVGLTEPQARQKYGDTVRVTSWNLKDIDRAKAERIEDGMIKVTSLKNGRILGASILAPHAGDHLPLWSLAISHRMKLKEIAGLILPYPTLGEISKSAASAFYKPVLFSPRTQKLARLLIKLPF